MVNKVRLFSYVMVLGDSMCIDQRQSIQLSAQGEQDTIIDDVIQTSAIYQIIIKSTVMSHEQKSETTSTCIE